MRLYTTLLALFLCASTTAQTIKGIVNDGEGAPIDYATVVLCNASDTTQLDYTVTSDDGRFSFNTPAVGQLLHVSYVGYEPQYLTASHNMTITLEQDVVAIGEVVVKSRRAQVVQQHGKLTVNVDRTILADAGSMFDLLKLSPGLIIDADDEIEVFGKGSPTIYIDNKEVHSKTELEALRSSDIDKIEIDRNPSAEYSAASKAIVRITTKRSRIDNTSVEFSDYLRIGRKVGNTAGVQINNKSGRWANLLSYSFSNFDNVDYSDSYETNIQPTYTIQNDGTLTHEYATDRHVIFSGNDYQLSEKSKLGVQLSANIGSQTEEKFNDQIFSKSNQEAQLRKINNYAHKTSELYSANLNYKLQIDSLSSLNVNTNYVYMDNGSSEQIVESNINNQSSSSSNINNSSHYNIYSAELTYNNEDLFGWLGFRSGLKYSQIQNSGKSVMTAVQTAQHTLGQSNNIDDRIAAGYINLEKQVGDLNLSAGARYESTSSHIIANGEQVDFSQNSLFPSAMIDYTSEKISSSLSYSRRVSRPSFSQLNPNITYFDSLSYAMGNPLLKPVMIDNIELYTSAYNLGLILGYSLRQNYIINTAINDPLNPDITQWTYLNIDRTSTISAGLTYSNRWRWYSGNYELYVDKPNTKITFVDEILEIKKPSFYLSLGNTFQLLDNLQLSVNFNYESAGESGITYYAPSYNLSASVMYKLLDEKLTLYLSAQDILRRANTGSWEDRYGNIITGMKANKDYRHIRLGVRINFNKIRSNVDRVNIDEIDRIR